MANGHTLDDIGCNFGRDSRQRITTVRVAALVACALAGFTCLGWMAWDCSRHDAIDQDLTELRVDRIRPLEQRVGQTNETLIRVDSRLKQQTESLAEIKEMLRETR